MKIEVLEPGLLTSIQDSGRHGFQMLGVNVGGAMDGLSHRIANILVGNDERGATIEITLKGPELFFPEYSLIAICGGDLSPKIKGWRVPMWRPVLINGSSRLRFGRLVTGCRAYLAHAGVMDVPSVLGSKSVNLRAGFGGIKGRKLKKGDVIRYGKPEFTFEHVRHSFRLPPHEHELGMRPFTPPNWSVSSLSTEIIPNKTPALRIIRGAHFDYLTEESRKLFLHETFRISSASDRMGYRLEGKPLKLNNASELLSEPVSSGTIQLPSNGAPIILLADHQTHGGYPRIAHVISIDLAILAQLRPGSQLSFSEVTIEEAHELYLKREHEIEVIKGAVAFRCGYR